MENFHYYNPAKILFGKNADQQVGKEIKKYGQRVLLVYGGTFVKELGIYDNLIQQFLEENITFVEFDKVVSNPLVEHVEEAIALCKEHDIQFVLAIGGGSAIDTAKAVAVGAHYSGPVWDFYDGTAEPTAALPVGTILTIPSSGSEMSNCSILSKDEAKVGLETDFIIPVFSVLNPTYTYSLPVYQTSVGIADIFSHLLERYFSNSENVNLTDFMLEGAMKSLIINAAKVLQDPSNYDYRAEIMWTASVAHNNLLDTGRVADWASHRIEHELSAQYNITHGEGMAIVFPAWMTYMTEHHPAKLAQLAMRVFNADGVAFSTEELAAQATQKVKTFFQSLGMAKNLTELNIDDQDFLKMATRATQNGPVGHYVPLDAEKIVDILMIALEN